MDPDLLFREMPFIQSQLVLYTSLKVSADLIRKGNVCYCQVHLEVLVKVFRQGMAIELLLLK